MEFSKLEEAYINPMTGRYAYENTPDESIFGQHTEDVMITPNKGISRSISNAVERFDNEFCDDVMNHVPNCSHCQSMFPLYHRGRRTEDNFYRLLVIIGLIWLIFFKKN